MGLRWSSVLVGAVALVTLGACGGDDAGVTAADPDTPVSSPSSSDRGVPDPAGWQRIEATGGATNPTSIAFDPGQADATDDGLLVRFYGGVDPCFVLDRAGVVETAQAVTVTLTGGAPAELQDAACIEIAVGYEVLVALDAPLGTRTVVDGSA
jgi:hypothetical protein